ncbi:hypothetical protein ACE6H2_001884 [Prunus campanulata]
MADGSRSEAGQSLQERVRNRFPGPPRKISEQEPQGERTEQELQKKKKKQAENIDKRTGGNHNNISGNRIYGKHSSNVGISNVGNVGYNWSSVLFLLGLILLILAFFFFFILYINGE